MELNKIRPTFVLQLIRADTEPKKIRLNIMKTLVEKTFTFTTYDNNGYAVETYTYEAYNVKEARKYAKLIVGNSRDNEARHGRVTLKK